MLRSFPTRRSSAVFFGVVGADGAPSGIDLRPVFAFQMVGSSPCDPLGTPMPSSSPTGTPPLATATETINPNVSVSINGGAARGGTASAVIEGPANRNCVLSSASAGGTSFSTGADGRALPSWAVPLTAPTGPQDVTVTCRDIVGHGTLNVS